METKRTLHIKEFNTSTQAGMKKAIEWEAKNPDWKLITSRLDFIWYFELEERNGFAYSNELNKWLNIKEFKL